LLLALLNCANRIELRVISKNSLAFITASMPTVESCHLAMNQQLQFIQRARRYAQRLNRL
jgi:hypothetical protein